MTTGILDNLQDIVEASWSYLNGHGKQISLDDIVHYFPGTFTGGNATVRKATLRVKDGTEKLVALKELKYSIGGGDSDNKQLRKLIKASFSFPSMIDTCIELSYTAISILQKN